MMGHQETASAAAGNHAEEQRYLAAAREAFPAWDIIQAGLGWQAVPKGTEVIASVTLDGLVAKLRDQEPPDPCGGAPDHEAVLIDFSAYSMDGPNTGCAANPENAWHYPAEGICKPCGGVIRAEGYGKPWVHTGRLPGDPR